MPKWDSGYVSDLGYTFGYYDELNPFRIKWLFMCKGMVQPNIRTACELGFGQGVSLNIHAAASDVEWYGTDFNPAQTSFAKEMSLVSGNAAKLHDESFQEFCERDDLPDFDFIGVHGIWSWINTENQQHIVDFVKKKLRVGGVLYISYNVFPGWNIIAPVRHLLTQYVKKEGSECKGLVGNVNDALSFAQSLFDTNPAYARNNPGLKMRFETLVKANRHYLVHEYFNKDWSPIFFSDFANRLSEAKIQYACSANYIDHIDSLNLSEEQQVFLRDISDPIFRETIRDFMTNQQFRRDYWVKGLRNIPASEQIRLLRDQRIVLLKSQENIDLKVHGAQGEGTLDKEVYLPLINIFQKRNPISLREIEDVLRLDKSSITLPQLCQAITILLGEGHCALVQNVDTIKKVKKKARSLNSYLWHRACFSPEIQVNACPVTGGGIGVKHFHQLFLLARENGSKTPSDCASFVWDILNTNRLKVIKEGKELDNADESLAELARQSEEFYQTYLPILQALEIA